MIFHILSILCDCSISCAPGFDIYCIFQQFKKETFFSLFGIQLQSSNLISDICMLLIVGLVNYVTVTEFSAVP